MNRKVVLSTLVLALLVLGVGTFASSSSASKKLPPTSLAQAMSGEHKGVGAQSLRPSGQTRGANKAPKGKKVTKDGVTVALNGCVVGYGNNGQCLPDTPGSASEMGMTRQQMPWQCEEVRLSFPAGLQVGKGEGKDPLHLDSNKDGTACGIGDRLHASGAKHH